MTYERPIINEIALACASVRSSLTCASVYIDILFLETIGAYQLDE
jgi:hypothetical protein